MKFQNTTELIDLRADYSAPAFYAGDWEKYFVVSSETLLY